MERNAVGNNSYESSGDTYMSKVKIIYGNFAVGAKDDFTPATTNTYATADMPNWSDNLTRDDMLLYNYCNPCENYQMPLDGTAVYFPDDMDANIGLMSEDLSTATGAITNKPILTLTSNNYYTSDGITLTFDTFKDVYATNVTITWYRDGSSIGSGTFAPDTAMYYCEKRVEKYNKVVIKFNSINMPYTRLRLFKIDYGEQITFTANNLRNTAISYSLSPISAQIDINSLNFTVDTSSDDKEYNFQTKQAFYAYNDTELLGTFFVKSSTRNSKYLYDVSAEDYISILDRTTYVGGIYGTDDGKTTMTAYALLEDIFTVADIPYVIDTALKSITINGHIPYTTCREALLQVCFATGAVAITAGLNYVEVVQNSPVTVNVGEERIMQGQNFTYEDIVTRIDITAHSFQQYSSAEDNILYNAKESGTGEDILVLFSEPAYLGTNGKELRLKKYNGTALGKIKEYGTNYAIIDAEVDTDGNYTQLLCDTFYKDVQIAYSKKNELLPANTAENPKQITSGKLVSVDNVNDVLDRCYAYYIGDENNDRNRTISCSIINDDLTTETGEISTIQSISVGQRLNVATEYLGELSGIVENVSFDLNGNIIVKEVTLR